MECLEHLSKGDLGPFPHHYLVHFQSYITSLGEGPVHGILVEGLAEGKQAWSVAGEQQVGCCLIQCLGGFILHLINGQEFFKDGHIWESKKKKERENY